MKMAKLKRKRQNTGIYVLLAGSHIDAAGRTYKKGDVVVDRENDLIAMFGDAKFREGDERDLEDMEDEAQVPAPARIVPDAIKGERTVAERQAEQEAAHSTLTEDSDAAEKAKTENAEEDEESESEEESPDFGEDVTKEFPGARKAKVKVFKKGKQYTVVDKDAPNAALNGDELHTPNQVNKYVEGL